MNTSKWHPERQARGIVDKIIAPALDTFAPNKDGKSLDEWLDSARGEWGGVEDFLVSLVDALGLGAGDYVHALAGVEGAPELVAGAIGKGCDIDTALRSAYETELEQAVREEVARRYGGWR